MSRLLFDMHFWKVYCKLFARSEGHGMQRGISFVPPWGLRCLWKTSWCNPGTSLRYEHLLTTCFSSLKDKDKILPQEFPFLGCLCFGHWKLIFKETNGKKYGVGSDNTLVHSSHSLAFHVVLVTRPFCTLHFSSIYICGINLQPTVQVPKCLENCSRNAYHIIYPPPSFTHY